MDDRMSQTLEQAAAFQKLWLDSLGSMANVWTEYSSEAPPPEEMRKMRNGMLKALAGTWDEFIRTPQFMEMMKVSLNGALDLKRMARDGMNKIHEQFETPTKEDLDSILLAIRHVERRVLEEIEGIDDRLQSISDRLEKIDGRIGKTESRPAKPDERIDQISERLEKIDGRLAKMETRAAKPDERIDQINERIEKVEGGIRKLGESIEGLSKVADERPETSAKRRATTK